MRSRLPRRSVSVPAPERPIVDASIRALLLILVLGSAIPFGSVQPGFVLVLQIGAAALFALSLSGPGIARASRGKAVALAWICAGVVGIGLLQVAIGTTSAPDTVDALCRFLAYAMLGWTAASTFNSPSQLRRAALAVVFAAAAIALYGSFEFLSGRQRILAYDKRFYLDSATGTFINRNHFATFLAMCLPLALETVRSSGLSRGRESWRRRLVRLVEEGILRQFIPTLAVFAILTGILLSFSRGGLLAAVLGLTAYVTVRRRPGTRRLAWLLIVLMPIILLTWQARRAPGERFVEDGANVASFGGRLPAWKTGWSMIADRPLLGTGFGSFEQAFPEYKPAELDRHWDHVHSDLLQFVIEGGSAAALLFIGFLIVLLRRSGSDTAKTGGRFRPAMVGGFAAAITHAAVDFPLRIPAIAALTALLVGLYVASEPRKLDRRVTRFQSVAQ